MYIHITLETHNNTQNEQHIIPNTNTIKEHSTHHNHKQTKPINNTNTQTKTQTNTQHINTHQHIQNKTHSQTT